MVKAIASDKKVNVVVTRRNGSDGTVTVEYNTYITVEEDHNAIEGEDFIPKTGTLIFKKGETEQTIEIDIKEKEEGEERDETFGLQLHTITPEGAKLSKKSKLIIHIVTDSDSKRK